MNSRLPILELLILVPLLGGIVLSRLQRPAEWARRWCLVISGLTLAGSIVAWLDFELGPRGAAAGIAPWARLVFTDDCLRIDALSAPLLPLAALLHLLVPVATLSSKIRRFSFAGSLVSQAITLATLSCREPWGVIGLLAVATLPPWWELRARRRVTRVFVLHMTAAVGLLITGWGLAELEGRDQLHSLWAILPLLGGLFIRCGIVPGHCWMADLFEKASFGTALLFVTPLTGAYAVTRLVLPIAPDWVLRGLGLVALMTTVYAAGMTLVQREGRRFFSYLFLSHSALVFVGLEIATPIGLTGALCVWLSVSIALGGFGLTLRALEARSGRVSLDRFRGMYEHTPQLAACFLLTGLASVGFPGTLGFIGTELLVDGAVQVYPLVGITVVLATALNGIAVVQVYFRLFTGARHVSTVGLTIRRRELVTVLILAALILGGGLYPQWTVASRHRAANELVRQRQSRLLSEDPASNGEQHYRRRKA